PGSKQLLPIAVHDHPRRQGLARRKEPSGESEPVARLAVGQLQKYRRNIGLEVIANFGEEVSPLEFPCYAPFVRLLFRHHRNVHGAHLAQLPLEVFEPGDCGRALRIAAEGRPAWIAAKSETNALYKCGA